MNIDGRIAEFTKKLQEQVKTRDTAIANIYWLQGAIAALTALKEDEAKPVSEIATEQ